MLPRFTSCKMISTMAVVLPARNSSVLTFQNGLCTCGLLKMPSACLRFSKAKDPCGRMCVPYAGASAACMSKRDHIRCTLQGLSFCLCKLDCNKLWTMTMLTEQPAAASECAYACCMAACPQHRQPIKHGLLSHRSRYYVHIMLGTDSARYR